MGHIRDRGGGRFEVTYDIGRDPVSARRRRRSVTVHGSRADAERELERIEQAVADGSAATGGRLTVAGFYAGWIDDVRVGVEPGTVRAYREKMETYVLPVIGSQRMTSIRGSQLTAIYRGMMDRGLSGRTALHAHTVAHRFFRDAQQSGVVARNPVDDAQRPQADRYVFRTWSVEDVRRFLDELPDDRWRDVWIMAVSLGTRRGELLGLEWQWVRPGRVFINQTVNGDGVIRPKPKRAASRRWVSIDPATEAAIGRLRATVADERAFYEGDYQDNGLVVCWEDGRPIRGQQFSKWFRAHRRRLGLPKIRLHDLRHTWATIALENDVPAKVVQDRLGHRSVSITLDMYTRTTDPVQDAAAAAVADAMGLGAVDP